jgi:hypothetical protein
MTPKRYDKDSQMCIQYFFVVDKDYSIGQWLFSGLTMIFLPATKPQVV